MSRRRKQTFRSSTFSALTRQLLYSPPEVRVHVVLNAERLHDELDPTKNYPIDFVVYRLTERRIPPSESVMLVGEAIKPDLRLLIDTLSRSVQMPVDEADPGMTTAELAQSLRVHTKTIGRWREQGLRWRWGEREGKPTVLVTRAALDAFDQGQQGRVAAASTFTRLTDEEKTALLNRAKRLSQATEVKARLILDHLAKRTGRSTESIRLLIKDHDTANPDTPIFAQQAGPLTGEQKIEIAQQYHNGETATSLCERFGKTRSTIYRAIHEERARQVSALTITFIHSPVFEREDADEVLMQPVQRQGQVRRLGDEVVAVLPMQVRSLYSGAIEPDEVVRSLMVRYNFLNYRAHSLQSEIRKGRARACDLKQFDALMKRVDSARGDVIAAVLPIVLSVVRRQLAGEAKEQPSSLLAMLYTAHRVLIEEIQLYDPAVSHSFESVLTNRLLRVLAGPTQERLQVDESALIEQLVEAGYSME